MLFMFLSVLFVRVDVLLHLFISDIPHLLEIFEAEVEAELTEADIVDFKKKINTVFDATICRRLMAVGLLYQLHPVSFGFSMDNFFVTSRTGKYFCGLIQRCIEKKVDNPIIPRYYGFIVAHIGFLFPMIISSCTGCYQNWGGISCTSNFLSVLRKLRSIAKPTDRSSAAISGKI